MCVELKPVTLINAKQSGVKKYGDYLKVKLRKKPVSSTSKTYEVKLALFENSFCL